MCVCLCLCLCLCLCVCVCVCAGVFVLSCFMKQRGPVCVINLISLRTALAYRGELVQFASWGKGGVQSTEFHLLAAAKRQGRGGCAETARLCFDSGGLGVYYALNRPSLYYFIHVSLG